MNTPAESPDRPLQGYIWPLLIVLLLGAQVTFLFVTVTLAVQDPSFAVEENYYDRAVNWDAYAKASRAIDDAGWNVQISLRDDADVLGYRTLVISILDAAGRPVRMQEIGGELFQHAQASFRQPLALTREEDDRYAANVRMEQAGWWGVRLTMTRDGAPYAFDADYMLYSLQGGVAWSR